MTTKRLLAAFTPSIVAAVCSISAFVLRVYGNGSTALFWGLLGLAAGLSLGSAWSDVRNFRERRKLHKAEIELIERAAEATRVARELQATVRGKQPPI